MWAECDTTVIGLIGDDDESAYSLEVEQLARPVWSEPSGAEPTRRL